MSELKVASCFEFEKVLRGKSNKLFYHKSEVDAFIAELQAENAQLKKEIEFMHSNCKWNAGDSCARLLGEKLAIINENVELKRENRKLKRALWLARVELCHRLDVDRYLRKHRNSWYNENCLTWNEACVAMEVKMCKAESKCRAKAEEYK